MSGVVLYLVLATRGLEEASTGTGPEVLATPPRRRRRTRGEITRLERTRPPRSNFRSEHSAITAARLKPDTGLARSSSWNVALRLHFSSAQSSDKLLSPRDNRAARVNEKETTTRYYAERVLITAVHQQLRSAICGCCKFLIGDVIVLTCLQRNVGKTLSTWIRRSFNPNSAKISRRDSVWLCKMWMQWTIYLYRRRNWFPTSTSEPNSKKLG